MGSAGGGDNQQQQQQQQAGHVAARDHHQFQPPAAPPTNAAAGGGGGGSYVSSASSATSATSSSVSSSSSKGKAPHYRDDDHSSSHAQPSPRLSLTGVSGSSTPPVAGGASYLSASSAQFLPGSSLFKYSFNKRNYDDDRSDAATIGTTVPEWDEKDEEAAAEEPVGFDAIKRWTLRVNNDAHHDGTNLTLPPQSTRAPLPLRSNSRSGVSFSPSLSVHPSASHTATHSLSTASGPSPSNLMSSSHEKIDPEVLASLVATMDEQEAQAVYNFVETYDGPDISAALYAHLAKIEDNAHQEMIIADDDGDRAADSNWEMLLPSSPKVGTDGMPDIAGAGALSDEADVWNMMTDTAGSASSDLVAEDSTDAIPTDVTGESSLKNLPKRALFRILLISGNVELLRVCRRLSRVPLPDSGPELAQLAFCLAAQASSSISPLSSSLPSSPTSVHRSSFHHPPEGVARIFRPSSSTVQELFLRCARAPPLNRSPDALPCLFDLVTQAVAQSSEATQNDVRPSVATLSAVMDLAARGRRWNTVRGAIALARRFSARPGSMDVDTAGAFEDSPAATVDITVPDLVEQHMRRHFVPEGEEATDASGGRGLHVSMAASMIANHGASLDVSFFQDLIEKQHLRFSLEVVNHCAQNYGIRPAVIELLSSSAS
ncbi:hypothetical protein DFJ73DRAFT_823908 [Zopfochytrium polystomum]|nr:hypothetical protein DFJ73DRAFT_823908 [Zopfochytrium polystomum]